MSVAVTDEQLALALLEFSKLGSSRQESILAAVRAAVAEIDDPYLRSIRDLASAGAQTDKPRYKSLRVKRAHRKSETAVKTGWSLLDQLPFRSECAYRFAYGDIAKRAQTRGRKRVSKSKREKAQRSAELETLCAGYLPGTGRAFAALLRKLDNDRSADVHAVFLDSWRNGEETFYQALWRTAGTGEGTFCYDAMFADWVQRCIPRTHPERKAIIRSTAATQKAFYRMARTYMSYRSLREMIALAMILPSRVRLPELLAKRYEDNGVEGGYSTRDCVELVLEAYQGDMDAAAQAILAHAKPMPANPWSTGFDAYECVYATQTSLVTKLTAGGGHTDQVLAAHKARRAALQNRVAQCARSAFVQELGR